VSLAQPPRDRDEHEPHIVNRNQVMTSIDAILCRLQVGGENTFNSGATIEARARRGGFSVWFRDHSFYPEGCELGSSEQRYDAQTLARIIYDSGITFRMWIDKREPRPSYAYRSVIVTGEHGLKAHMLRLIFTEYIEGRWLMDQSDASFHFLEDIIGEPSDEDWDRAISPIEYLMRFVGIPEPGPHERDLLNLLHGYGLPATRESFDPLLHAVKRDHERYTQEREAQRQALIAPFRDQIEMIAGKFSDFVPRPGRPPIKPWSKRAEIRRFLEDYVVKHARMPQGRFQATIEGEMGTRTHLGTLDFDELSKPEHQSPQLSSGDDAS
jgi:hypothetical protein